MRRIYESRALHRDDDPHTPAEASDSKGGFFRSDESRTINWSAASHALLPNFFRRRGVTVDVETNKSVYAADEPVGFRVRMHNRLPLPVSLRVPTPVRWEWAIDGYPEASRYEEPAPSESQLFRFDRGERKTFERHWSQRFRESEREWSPAGRGEHILSAYVAVDDPEERGLYAETTFRIE